MDVFTNFRQYKNANIANFVLAVPLEINKTNGVYNLKVWTDREAAAAASSVASGRLVFATSLDAPNGSQIHCLNLTLHLTLPLTLLLDAQSVHTLKM